MTIESLTLKVKAKADMGDEAAKDYLNLLFNLYGEDVEACIKCGESVNPMLDCGCGKHYRESAKQIGELRSCDE